MLPISNLFIAVYNSKQQDTPNLRANPFYSDLVAYCWIARPAWLGYSVFLIRTETASLERCVLGVPGPPRGVVFLPDANTAGGGAPGQPIVSSPVWFGLPSEVGSQVSYEQWADVGVLLVLRGAPLAGCQKAIHAP